MTAVATTQSMAGILVIKAKGYNGSIPKARTLSIVQCVEGSMPASDLSPAARMKANDGQFKKIIWKKGIVSVFWKEGK